MSVDPGTARAVEVRTVRVDDEPDLAALLPDDGSPLVWLAGGSDQHGLIGWGELARLETTGPGGLRRAAEWFAALVDGLTVVDDVRRPGSGPVLFASGAFDPRRAASVFVVPRVVLGRDDEGTWLTTIAPGDRPRPTPAPAGPGAVTYAEGNLTAAEWVDVVGEAVRRIRDGRLDKVVLARDLFAETAEPLDVRWLVRRLATAYPRCWTYAVDGLVGATPELLVRLVDGRLSSLVLAGTEWGDEAADRVGSAKNRAEHAFGVQSAVAALEKVTVRLEVPDEPSVLRLPNLVHLATEVHGDTAPEVGPLDVVEAMHPTAAVGGAPSSLALDAITELEGMNRGRYAGPVGWADAAGNGAFGIALRGGQLESPYRIRLYAGCGIVADSDPPTELAETLSKFVPMRDALEG